MRGLFWALFCVAPLSGLAATYPTVQQAYDACRTQMATAELAYTSAGRSISSDKCWRDTSTNCFNMTYSYTNPPGTDSSPDVQCFATNTCVQDGSSSALFGYPGNVVDGSAVCDHGCSAAFHCNDQACHGSTMGQSVDIRSYGHVTDTSNACGSEPDIFAGNGIPPKPESAPQCSGSQCLKPYDTPPHVCDSNTGVCADTPSKNEPNKKDCGANSTSAECSGNPPPPPPDPPATDSCPGSAAQWTLDGMPFWSNDYPNCPQGPDSGCGPDKESVNGQCIPRCGQGQTWNGTGCRGTCQAGQVDRGNGCEPYCKAPQVQVGTQCQDQCMPGYVANGTGGCNLACGLNQSQSSDGSGCKSTCSGVTQSGACASSCSTGYTADANKICQPNTCGGGQVVLNGGCATVCSNGMIAVGSPPKCDPGNQANGGTDCNAPPSCSGDQALCSIDYQVWAGRCASKSKVSGGGDCGSAPTCSDATDPQCSIATSAWHIRCADSAKISGGGDCSGPPTCPDPTNPQCALVIQAWNIQCQPNNKITGGTTCTTAPVCGMATNAECQVATQAWNIRCAIKNPKFTGGNDCQTAPECDTGNTDLAVCGVLKQEWLARCAFSSTDTHGTDGTTGADDSDAKVIHESDEDGGLGSLDEGVFSFGGGSCPQLPTFTVLGHTFALSSVSWWCDALAVIGGIVYFFGAFFAARVFFGV
jgi:hypothetical protein